MRERGRERGAGKREKEKIKQSELERTDMKPERRAREIDMERESEVGGIRDTGEVVGVWERSGRACSRAERQCGLPRGRRVQGLRGSSSTATLTAQGEDAAQLDGLRHPRCRGVGGGRVPRSPARRIASTPVGPPPASSVPLKPLDAYVWPLGGSEDGVDVGV